MDSMTFVCLFVVASAFTSVLDGVVGDQESEAIKSLRADMQSVNKQIWSRLMKTETKVESLEKEIQDLKASVSNLSTRNANCEIYYGVRCFWAVLIKDITMIDGKKICQDSGGDFANVYSSKHFGEMAEYVKIVTPGGKNGHLHLWTGMVMNPVNWDNRLFLSDGSRSDFDLEWADNYPMLGDGRDAEENRISDYTGVLFQAFRHKDYDEHNGLVNDRPETVADGVLCEA